MAHTPDSFDSFKSFYPYYLQEHKNKTCRLFHFIGSSLVLGVLLYVLNTGHWIWLWFCLVRALFIRKKQARDVQTPLL